MNSLASNLIDRFVKPVAKFLALFDIKSIENSKDVFNIVGTDGYRFISVSKDDFKNTRTYFIDDWIDVEFSYVEVLKIDNESWGRSHNWVLRPFITETADGEFNFYIYSKQEGNGAFGQFNSVLDCICDSKNISIPIESIDNFKGNFQLASTKNDTLALLENFSNSKNLKFRISGATGDKHPLSDLSNENIKSHFQLIASDLIGGNKWESEVEGFRRNYKTHLINQAIENYKIKAILFLFVIFVIFIAFLDKIFKSI